MSKPKKITQTDQDQCLAFADHLLELMTSDHQTRNVHRINASIDYLSHLKKPVEDIEKAIICLIAMRDLIENKHDVIHTIQNFKARQVIHEFKQVYK